MSRSTRESLAERVARIGTTSAKALAEFASRTGANGAQPCWGAIAEHIEKNMVDDASLESLWRAMVEVGDSRPQLVLLSILKDKPKLIELAARDEGRVSPVVRQALTALRVPENTESNRGFETRVNELLAVRYFVPDSVEPQRESQRRSK
ncbi:MAG: hypothetical protein ACOC1F_08900 [Myxococcota bacterium]